MKKSEIILLGILILGSQLNFLFAQGPETAPSKQVLSEKSMVLRTSDNTSLMDFSGSTLFPNVNEKDYHFDKKVLARIRQLEQKGDVEELEPLLETYIQSFGIENFRKNVSLLWLAGRLKQVQGDTAQAVFYYELADVHNYGTPAPKLTYDSLTMETSSEWLAIDKYYELLEVRKKIDPLIPPKKVLENMGDMINSRDADYAPFMHPSDSVMIFTSRRDTSGVVEEDFVDPFKKQNEDLYYAQLDFISGDWQPAERLPSEINSNLNEGSACLSPDGKKLYFVRCGADNGYGDCDLYQADFDGNDWSNIRNLGKGINSEYWDSQPNITSDGKTIFFASNRKGGFGGTDLYYTSLTPEGNWAPARNLGPLVNSPRHEVTPFYHRINGTLYFSSTGQLKNFGGYDIFKARWLGDQFDQPKNIGPLVNTPGNEYYFSINGNGTTIFYSNSKDKDRDHIEQNFDLYSFPMPMEARPDAVAALKGFLVDSISGNPLVGTVMIIDLENGVEVAPKRINERGYFEFDLINNNRYRIYVLGDNFLTVKKDFEMRGDTAFQVFTQSFAERKPIVFEALEFASNSTRLRGQTRPKLDYIVRFLQAYPMFKVEVEGHTDSDGPEQNNLRLSKARAQKIAEYIIVKGGFHPDRVSSNGYGESRPLVPNDTDENKKKNRRVEFKLIWDKSFDGEDMWLPSEGELMFPDDEELLYDEEIDDGFEEWEEGERDSWDDELDLDEELDLDAELEDDIFLDKKKKPDTDTRKKPPIKKGSSTKKDEKK